MTLVSSLRAQVELGVVRLLALVPPPIGLVVVERPWWRLVVDGMLVPTFGQTWSTLRDEWPRIDVPSPDHDAFLAR